MHTMHVLSQQGDTETRWDPSDPESIRKAQQLFKQYMRDNCLAFSAREPGGEAFQVKDFDPEAGEIVITHPLIGG